jgi:MFS family permease
MLLRLDKKTESIKAYKIFIPPFLFAILDISFIGVFLVPLVNIHVSNAFTVSLILITKNLSRVLTDVPLGILADKLSIKTIFLIARICRIIAVVLLLNPNYITLTLSMFFYGISMSGIYGKIDTYLYQASTFVGKQNQSQQFTSILSIYYTICDFAMILCGLLSMFLLKALNYNGLIYLTIATTTISIFILPFIAKIPKKTYHKKILPTAIKTIFSKPILIYIYIIISVGNAIIWQSNSILSMLMLKLGFNVEYISLTHSFVTICISIGYLGSAILSRYFKFSLNIIKSGLPFITLMLLIFASLLHGIGILSFILFSLAILSFPILHVNASRILEKSIDNNIRATLTSMSTFLSSVFNIICTPIFGFITQNYNFNTAILTIVGLMWTLVAIATLGILYNLCFKKNDF